MDLLFSRVLGEKEFGQCLKKFMNKKVEKKEGIKFEKENEVIYFSNFILARLHLICLLHFNLFMPI